jgi:phosphatidylglycerophosphatase A
LTAGERSLSDRLSRLVLTFGGSGEAPAAPGTFGSLAAALVVGGLWLAGGTAGWILPALAAAIALLHLAVGDRTEVLFGEVDPPSVVSDEACGQWIALAPLPWLGVVGPGPGSTATIVLPLLLGFALFRLFDITKILGVGRLERIPGKWGVLLDDVLAGVLAALVLTGLHSLGLPLDLAR